MEWQRYRDAKRYTAFAMLTRWIKWGQKFEKSNAAKSVLTLIFDPIVPLRSQKRPSIPWPRIRSNRMLRAMKTPIQLALMLKVEMATSEPRHISPSLEISLKFSKLSLLISLQYGILAYLRIFVFWIYIYIRSLNLDNYLLSADNVK